MRTMKVFEFQIVPFAGFFKIVNTTTGNRVGGVYSSYEEAYDACISLKRNYLGIVAKKGN